MGIYFVIVINGGCASAIAVQQQVRGRCASGLPRVVGAGSAGEEDASSLVRLRMQRKHARQLAAVVVKHTRQLFVYRVAGLLPQLLVEQQLCCLS